MLGLKGSIQGVAVSVLVVGVVAAVTLGVLTLLGVTFQGAGEAQTGDGSTFVDTALVTANRDRLRLCIDRLDVSAVDLNSGKTALDQALSEASNHQFWEPSGLAENEPVVDVGCPTPPALFEPDAYVTERGFGLFVEVSTRVDEASPYRTFVYVISKEKLQETFGENYPIATQETLKRSNHEFGAVTLALFVTPDQLQDRGFLSQWLLVTSGVLPASSVGGTG